MDDDQKDEFSLQIEARMKAPLVWDSSPSCIIQDLLEPQYDEVLRLIKHHYFREEPMCKACALLHDQPSVNGYLELVRTWMQDTTSLVACSKKSGRVIGVAITRIDSLPEKTDVYNRAQGSFSNLVEVIDLLACTIAAHTGTSEKKELLLEKIFEGTKFNNIMHLMNALILQTDPYEKFGQQEYFRIYLVCVHPSYQEKDVEVALLDACVQAAKSLKFSSIGGIFTSGASQMKARSFGFTLLSEIRYSRWVVDDRVVFNDPGRGNYSAAFMGMSIEIEDGESRTSNNTIIPSYEREISVKSNASFNSQSGTLKSVESNL